VLGVVLEGKVRSDIFFGSRATRDRNLFAGVKNIFRIENFLHLFKNGGDPGAVHFLQIRSSNEAVVVLGGDRTLVSQNQIINFLGQFIYYLRHARPGKIHQGNDVEIPVAGVAGNRIDQFVLAQNPIELRQKFRQEFRADNNVINKRSGALAMNVFPKEIEALPPDIPILARLVLSLVT